MAHPNSLANLQLGRNKGTNKRLHYGDVFRNCFSDDDIKEVADTLKSIYRDPDNKDRFKALELVLKKLVADEIPEGAEVTLTKEDVDALAKQLGVVVSTAPAQEVQP